MFSQQPHYVSLNAILQSPENFSWTGTNGDEKSLNMSFHPKSDQKSRVSCVVTNIDDFNLDSFTLLNLARLYSVGEMSWAADSLIKRFFCLVSKCNETEQGPYLSRFFGQTTFQELHVQYPEDAKMIVRLLLDSRETMPFQSTPNFRGLRKAPAILLQYADYLAHQQTALPAVLLQEIDLQQAFQLSSYKSVSPCLYNSSFSVEGYWTGNRRNLNAFNFAEKNIQQDKLSPEALTLLRSFILETEKPGEHHRYPLPEATPWKDMDKVLAVLKTLAAMSIHRPEDTRAILSLRIHDPELVNNLLLMNLDCYHYIGHKCVVDALPIKGEGEGEGEAKVEYTAKMPDGGELMWADMLPAYMERYNIVPAADFLLNLVNFTLYCSNEFRNAADKVKTYLSEHPLQLEDDIRPAAALRS
jgi:hypothetical protein